MKYSNTTKAEFKERINRFLAKVSLDGKTENVHVKNTGRCKELLLPGAEVVLSDGMNPDRKTKYDLVTVKKANIGWINIDSQAPNIVTLEWLKGDPKKRPEEFRKITYLKPEYTYGNSRVDFYLETENKRILMEVKGCTLEINGIGYFPDAPTERGIKHLKELTKATKEGYESYIAFVIPMNGIDEVRPNMKTHPAFGIALKEAEESGVHVLFLMCDVMQDELKISQYKIKNTDHSTKN